MKLLRTLGNNLPEATKEDGEVDLAPLLKDPRPAEGSAVEVSNATGEWLKKHGLAEPAADDPGKAGVGGQHQPGRTHGPARER